MSRDRHYLTRDACSRTAGRALIVARSASRSRHEGPVTSRSLPAGAWNHSVQFADAHARGKRSSLRNERARCKAAAERIRHFTMDGLLIVPLGLEGDIDESCGLACPVITRLLILLVVLFDQDSSLEGSPGRMSATSCGALTARQRCCADSISLNAIASPGCVSRVPSPEGVRPAAV